MGTYGNYDVACEALSCFIHQDYHNKELIIVNHHEVPLHFKHPQVTIINLKPEEVPTLRHVKMVGMQKSNGKYIHFWDNDDLYLPWHLTDCMKGIKNTDKPAWKPKDVWISLRNKEYHRSSNICEGTWIFDRTKISLDEYYTKHPEYADPPFYWDILMEKNLEEPIFGALTSYVYRWATGDAHHSLIENPKTGNYINDYSIIASNYRKQFHDAGDGKTNMKIVDLKKYWKDILEQCVHPPMSEEFSELYTEEMKQKLEEKFAPYIRDCGCGKKSTPVPFDTKKLALEQTPKIDGTGIEAKRMEINGDDLLLKRIEEIEKKLGIVPKPKPEEIKPHSVALECSNIYTCGECYKRWTIQTNPLPWTNSEVHCPHCKHKAYYIFKST
tara:strand:+ start:906 stop:2057 length:1152 start_codon:yes stop_codon:yes gene_type:complete